VIGDRDRDALIIVGSSTSEQGQNRPLNSLLAVALILNIALPSQYEGHPQIPATLRGGLGTTLQLVQAMIRAA
jgi:hypothetical protein